MTTPEMKPLTLEELEELEAHGTELLFDNPDTWALLLLTAKLGATRPTPPREQHFPPRFCNKCGTEGFKGDWSECFTQCETCWPVSTPSPTEGKLTEGELAVGKAWALARAKNTQEQDWVISVSAMALAHLATLKSHPTPAKEPHP